MSRFSLHPERRAGETGTPCAFDERVPETRAVRLGPADDVRALAPLLPSLQLIVISFPKFSEGRGYTQARLLRESLGYRGVLRAEGSLTRDLLNFLVRSGFDEVDLADGEDPAAWTETLARFAHVYQPAADGRQPAFLKRTATP